MKEKIKGLIDIYMFLDNTVLIKYFIEEMKERVQISYHTAIN